MRGVFMGDLPQLRPELRGGAGGSAMGKVEDCGVVSGMLRFKWWAGRRGDPRAAVAQMS